MWYYHQEHFGLLHFKPITSDCIGPDCGTTIEIASGCSISGRIICSLWTLNHWIMTVNPHCSVVVRDRESEDLPVKLHLPPYQSEQLNRRSHRKRHAVGVLSIGDVQRGSTTLYFARQEREVHVVRGHEVRRVRQLANKWPNGCSLLSCSSVNTESHGVVGLQARPRSKGWNCSSLR